MCASMPTQAERYEYLLLAVGLWFSLSISNSAHASEPAISVSVAVPARGRDAERSIVPFDRHSHFHVILTNTSDAPQRIAADGNSWGDEALSFEITDESGKQTIARRPMREYMKNMLSWWVLEPHENLVLDVYFNDPERWHGFPHSPEYGDWRTVKMRAVFEVKPSTVPSKDKLWTGRAVSPNREFSFHNRAPAKK